MTLEKKQYTDEELVKMMQSDGEDSQKALHYIYVKWYSHTKRTLMGNRKIKNVEDAINDGVLILYKHIRNRKYQPMGKLKNYFIGICLRCGQSQGRKLKKVTFTDDNFTLDKIVKEQPATILLKEEVKATIGGMLKQLSKECQELLRLYMFSYSMKEIDALLDIGDVAKTRHKVYRCRKRLEELLKKKPSIYNHLKRRNEAR